jgi:hypothetical protein
MRLRHIYRICRLLEKHFLRLTVASMILSRLPNDDDDG